MSLVDVQQVLGGFPDLLNQQDEQGSTCLMRACEFGKLDVVQYLLSMGADLELATNDVILNVLLPVSVFSSHVSTRIFLSLLLSIACGAGWSQFFTFSC